ncbi:Phosphoribosylformylglycinamidine synthase, PurS subunit / Phosphoribosylformylglycinamidine synthase, synthetase subunit, partial [hydrothermal vent metagenome]
MIWRVEIKNKDGVFDSHGESTKRSIVDLGLETITQVETVLVYNLETDSSKEVVSKIVQDLLSDPITQKYSITNEGKPILVMPLKGRHLVEIAYHPGVMDPVERSTLKGIKDIGVKNVSSVRTAIQYILSGKLTKSNLSTITDRILLNKLIQHKVSFPVKDSDILPKVAEHQFNRIIVDLLKASDRMLVKLSKDGQLFLSLDEMKVIQKYFRKLKRNPIDCELETIAQTWSEHCFHKTFRGTIQYTYVEGGKKKTSTIKNLLKTTIVKATEELNKPWCVSVFHDNAGVIKFDKESNICFKVETHNHPSALEPFGGANTGIGGVLRDILGTGLGAKPICNTDVFCFAPPDMKLKDLPKGTLHPKRVMKGVVSGVRDYGNKMGIPTVNGSLQFDEKFVGNPLVYCGSIGIMPKDKVKKKVGRGDLVVVVGGKTGRDGIHGATFSSGELTDESEVVSSGAVQIGDPIAEKKVMDAQLLARDKGLYTAVTDCGAGGLSSAVGEMGEILGVRVNLEKVPLKYHGLSYTEIWISESQERMVFSVKPSQIKKFLDVFESENVEATVIGEFIPSKKLELFFDGNKVCSLDMDFLYDGNPRVAKKALFKAPKKINPRVPKKEDLTSKLKEVLSHYNVCSKEWVVRQYDHEVQGGSIVKPFVGVKNDGPSDAAVITPKLGSSKGIAVSNGINIRYGMIDPYWMA